jgi:uncharacterized protein (DUF2384 family)
MKVSKETIAKELEKLKKEIEFTSKYADETTKRELKVPIERIELIKEMVELWGKSDNRKKGIAKATEARSKATKKKIENAINIIRMEGEEITPYKVAKVAGVHFNTAKKWLEA